MTDPVHDQLRVACSMYRPTLQSNFKLNLRFSSIYTWHEQAHSTCQLWLTIESTQTSDVSFSVLGSVQAMYTT